MDENWRDAIYGKGPLLFIGIVQITLCFLLFNGQQYFSFWAMLAAMVIFACGALSLFMASFASAAAMRLRWAVLLSMLVSALAIAYELYFDLQYASPGTAAAIASYLPVAAAALLPIASVYLVCTKFSPERRKNGWAMAVAILVIVSIVTAYVVISALQALGWLGTDEIAFNYYAATLFASGANPYTTSMFPVLSRFGLDPTLRLNSSCECQYGYPALSFLPYIELKWLNVQGYYPLVYTTVLCVILAAFIVYIKSGKRLSVLLLLLLFAVIAYAVTPAGSAKYLAVALFLLIAYAWRERKYLSGIFLGLAASTHPLAWFALPFFYALSLNEHGKARLLSSVIISVAVFLLVNGYFIALSPKATVGNFFVFGSELAFVGPSLMQLLQTFYTVPYWYSTAIVLIFYLASLALFCMYTDTLKALLAIVPGTMFFLSTVNDLVYLTAFVPMLIMIHYAAGGGARDMLHDKKWIGYTALTVLAIAIALLVYAHSSYASSNKVAIDSALFSLSANQTTGKALIYGANVELTNSGGTPTSVFFYLIARNPSKQSYVVGSPPFELYPGTSSFAYPYFLHNVSSSTEIYLFVLSNNYTESVRIPLTAPSKQG